MQKKWRWFDMNIKHNTLAILLIMVVILMIAVTSFPGILLPTVYLGVSALMIIVAVLMFAAGYFYGTTREERIHRSETITMVANPNKSSESSNETTITTSSTPNRSAESGRYEQGRHIEQTKTVKSSSSEDGEKPEGHQSSVTTTTILPGKSHESGRRVEQTRTQKSSRSEES